MPNTPIHTTLGYLYHTAPPNHAPSHRQNEIHAKRSTIIVQSIAHIPHVHLKKPTPPGNPHAPPSIGAVHPASPRGLLARAPGERALELEQRAADLVADGRAALLVVHRGGVVVVADGDRGVARGADLATAAEEAAAAGGDGCGHRAAAGEERHVGWLWVWLCGGCVCGLGWVGWLVLLLLLSRFDVQGLMFVC